MHKSVLFLYYIAIHLNVYGLHKLDTPPSQLQAKKDIVFSNGKTYENLESELKAQHPGMPESVIIKGYGLGTETIKNKIVNACYVTLLSVCYSDVNDAGSVEEKKISKHYFIVPEKINELSYNAAKFILMHEIGHSQDSFPDILLPIRIYIAIVGFPIARYWTKIIEPVPVLSTVIKSCLGQAAEERADNFAIKYADQAVLEGGLQYFTEAKKQLQKEYSETALSLIFPFKIGWKLKQLAYPSIDSRIAKVRSALKSRYGVNAQSKPLCIKRIYEKQ